MSLSWINHYVKQFAQAFKNSQKELTNDGKAFIVLNVAQKEVQNNKRRKEAITMLRLLFDGNLTKNELYGIVSRRYAVLPI